MALKDDLKNQVEVIVSSAWEETEGKVVPETDSLPFENKATKFNGTVLYADLKDSTTLVDKYKPYFAAEIYKCFLYCAARIIGSEGGTVTAYDGDRVMAVFIGNSKNTSAARAAFKIKYAVDEIINPALKSQYSNDSFQVRHTVGIDTSSLYVTKTGVRGANDLVWVGRAANYAAKLTTINDPVQYSIFITKSVFEKLADDAKYGGNQQSLMWEEVSWSGLPGIALYRSKWLWTSC